MSLKNAIFWHRVGAVTATISLFFHDVWSSLFIIGVGRRHWCWVWQDVRRCSTRDASAFQTEHTKRSHTKKHKQKTDFATVWKRLFYFYRDCKKNRI